MAYIKPILFIMLLLAASYASLWFGFVKGWDYRHGELSDAFMLAINLDKLRNGKTDEAIESLEMQLDTHIISSHYSDRNFIKYIAVFGSMSEEDGDVYTDHIRKYKESHGVGCSSQEKEVCDAIQKALYPKKAP